MFKKALVVGIFVLSVLLTENYCWAGKRSLDSDKQVNAFISSLRKDSKWSQSLYDSLKEELIYARKNFDEKSALKFLSELEDANIEDPNDRSSMLCGHYLLTFTYLYYDNPAKLMNLYDNMSNYSRDRFVISLGSYLLPKVGEPFFEVSKKYLLDLASRWRTEEATSNHRVLSGMLLLRQSPKEKYIPVIKEMLKEEGVSRLYPRTVVRYVCTEKLPGMEDGVKSYFANYAVDLDEADWIAHYLVEKQGTYETGKFLLKHRVYYEKKLKAISSARAIVREYIRHGDTDDR